MLTFLKKAALSIDGSQGIPLRAGDGINKVSFNDFARFTSMARRGYPVRGKDVLLTRQADGAQTIAACKNLDPSVLEGDGRRTETRILTLTHVERQPCRTWLFCREKLPPRNFLQRSENGVRERAGA